MIRSTTEGFAQERVETLIIKATATTGCPGQALEQPWKDPGHAKIGAEAFTVAGAAVGRTLVDFRGWCMSDLLNNAA